MDSSTFRSIPKAELHVHLEGALRLPRVAALAAKMTDHPWCGLSPEQLQALFQTRSFQEFLRRFMEGYSLLRQAEDFQAVTEDLCAELQRQGVSYAEVLYSPGIYIQKLGVRLRHIHDGIEAGLRHFPGMAVSFVVDTVLNLGYPFMETTLMAVLRDRRDFLRGFSVGGGLPDLDMRDFLPLFHQAEAAGLFCVAHAGEVDGPENIRILIEETSVRRIAHGCAAATSPDLCRQFERRGIGIDVSLTSNLRTGAVSDLARHPILRFLEHGISVSLNTDDPLYFQTDLWREYQLAQQALGLDDACLQKIMAYSLSQKSG